MRRRHLGHAPCRIRRMAEQARRRQDAGLAGQHPIELHLASVGRLLGHAHGAPEQQRERSAGLRLVEHHLARRHAHHSAFRDDLVDDLARQHLERRIQVEQLLLDLRSAHVRAISIPAVIDREVCQRARDGQQPPAPRPQQMDGHPWRPQACARPTPRRRRMISSGQKCVNALCTRLKPTKAVNHSQFALTNSGLPGTPSASDSEDEGAREGADGVLDGHAGAPWARTAGRPAGRLRVKA